MYPRPKQKVKEPDSQEHAHNYALFLLGLRLRTKGEMREKMQQRGYSEAVIAQEIENLNKLNYLDDERFAEILIDNLKKYKNHGYYQIKKKLMIKRLSAQTIEKALDENLSIEDELKIGKRFLKKESSLNIDSFKAKQKVVQRLKTRGFRNEVVMKLIV